MQELTRLSFGSYEMNIFLIAQGFTPDETIKKDIGYIVIEYLFLILQTCVHFSLV